MKGVEGALRSPRPNPPHSSTSPGACPTTSISHVPKGRVSSVTGLIESETAVRVSLCLRHGHHNLLHTSRGRFQHVKRAASQSAPIRTWDSVFPRARGILVSVTARSHFGANARARAFSSRAAFKRSTTLLLRGSADEVFQWVAWAAGSTCAVPSFVEQRMNVLAATPPEPPSQTAAGTSSSGQPGTDPEFGGCVNLHKPLPETLSPRRKCCRTSWLLPRLDGTAEHCESSETGNKYIVSRLHGGRLLATVPSPCRMPSLLASRERELAELAPSLLGCSPQLGTAARGHCRLDTDRRSVVITSRKHPKLYRVDCRAHSPLSLPLPQDHLSRDTRRHYIEASVQPWLFPCAPQHLPGNFSLLPSKQRP